MKRKWNVYVPFLANEFKRNLAYKGSFYLMILCSIFAPFISYYLWMAIYGSAGGGMLGGLTRVVNVDISKEISRDVREGAVVMTLIKPLDYRMTLISKAMGGALYAFFAPAVFVWIGLEIYKVAVLGMGVTPLPRCLAYLVSMVMSFFIYVLFDFCFGMVAFVTTYMFGMNMAKEAILGFLSGQLIPISFFPEALQRIFDFLPFSSMIYTPVMVYLGKYQGMELALVLGRQLLWVVLLYALGTFLWSRITRRLIVLGG